MTDWKNKLKQLILSYVLAMALPALSVNAAELNGFKLESKTLDSQFVLKIGEPGSIQEVQNDKNHYSKSKTDWADSELVLGIVINSQSHAYLLDSLYHQPIVNDTVDGIPVLVVFCALCGTGSVYDRGANGQTLTFADSGLLYRADELIYDQQTRSLWSPFLNAAVSGASEGQELPVVPSRITYWSEWKQNHPDTTTNIASLSGLDKSGETAHQHSDDRKAGGHGYHPKTPTLGLSWPDGDAIAFTASEILEAGGKVSETIAGTPVSISFNSESQEFELDSSLKHEVFQGTWADWKTNHPKGRWYTATNPKN